MTFRTTLIAAIATALAFAPAAAAHVEITAVTHDSRRTGPGACFCCIPGATSDGHDHAGEQTTPPAGTPRAAKPQGERKAKKDKKTGTGQAQE